MKAKKIFCVVAYDIENDRQRTKIAKLLEKFGTRINYSVFECLFTEKQLENTQVKIEKQVQSKKDSVVFYRICVECYTKTIHLPQRKRIVQKVEIV